MCLVYEWEVSPIRMGKLSTRLHELAFLNAKRKRLEQGSNRGPCEKWQKIFLKGALISGALLEGVLIRGPYYRGGLIRVGPNKGPE